jgi:hypothetical protein
MLTRLTPLLAGAVLLFGAPPAFADHFSVATTAGGTSTCTGGPPNWTCPTLEGAIAATNADANEDDISLDAPGTYFPNSTLSVSHDVAIIGLGARVTQIDGNEEIRVLDVSSSASVTLFNVTIQNGDVGSSSGGNIRNGGNLTLGFTRVTGGTASIGGGIANSPGGQLGVFYSLIDSNTALGGSGGGISSTGSVDANVSHVDVADSTIALNSAATGGGAGIFLNGNGGDARIDYTTIARNITGGGIALANDTVEVDISASLIAANTGGNCPSAFKPIDEQYNLDDGTSCQLDDPTSKSGVDPQLNPAGLTNEGGGTNVITFPATSPAVDMVTQCLVGIDQRAFQRISSFGQPCDAGAYEQSATGPTQPTISSAPPATTTATSASFSFSSAEPADQFMCQLTGPGQPGDVRACTSPQSYSGLAPGDYVFSVWIADETGQVPTGSPTVRSFRVTSPAAQTPTPTPTPTPTATPTPVPQKDATGKTSGTVLIKQGGKFVPFDSSKPIPDGAEIDVTKGKITLTAVLKPGGKPQTATFYDGIFKLKLGKTTTDLTLSQPLAPCGKGKAGAAAKKPKSRKLWGDGAGSFRTRGQYSAATVRGTTWLVQDSCAGTLTKVKKGVVSVFDQVKKRTIVLRAGKQYLAKPRR